MRRVVEPELLDSLHPSDPAAVWSRRDLRRVNWWMRNEAHIARAIESLRKPPLTILELGAGDGTFMLRVARRLQATLPGVRLYLLDREPVVQKQTLQRFGALGWTASVIKADIFEWLKRPQIEEVKLITANLFLHHFQDVQLKTIFENCAARADTFIACEPRRWQPALLSTRLLWTIGCNHVTRHDAYVSVRAGFRDEEISDLWPDHSRFQLSEAPAGLASHLFVATNRHL